MKEPEIQQFVDDAVARIKRNGYVFMTIMSREREGFAREAHRRLGDMGYISLQNDFGTYDIARGDPEHPGCKTLIAGWLRTINHE